MDDQTQSPVISLHYLKYMNTKRTGTNVILMYTPQVEWSDANIL